MTGRWGPYPAHALVAGDGSSLTVVPRRGGKIVSLVSAGGREWLTQAQRPVSETPSGLPFVAAEMCGWDECCPSIDPAVRDGVAFSDHGDLWDAAWTTLSADSHSLLTRAMGSDFPYALERRIVAGATGFRLEYEATSMDTVPRPFLWAAHPQLRAEPGSRVELPGVRAVFDKREPLVELDPATADQRVAAGSSRKWWSARDARPSRAVLVHPDGASLELAWQGDCVRWVGVWFDGGEYAAERVIALEPSTGWYDNVATAEDTGAVAVLAPGETLRWTLVVSTRTGS